MIWCYWKEFVHLKQLIACLFLSTSLLLLVFISAAIAVCYLFLLVYTWIFLGDTIRLQIQLIGVNIVLLAPFTSLQWLMGFYGVLGITSFVVWCVGSSLLSSASLCITTAPLLFSYATFLIAIYWLGFCIVIIYSIKLFYGDVIAAVIKEQVRPPTMAELEDRVFCKAFADFDKAKENRMANEDVSKLLQALGESATFINCVLLVQ